MADILRDYVRAFVLGAQQHRVVCHLLACRTGQLGGHRAKCDRCGAVHFAYHSCRDRHCPTCGSLDQALWAEAQLQHLLPVSYFHLVFTIPPMLRPFFMGPGRRLALEALFAAVAQTLLEVGQTNLHARLGILAVLHTWTQRLDQHPHLHCLVPGGGLADGQWVDRRKYLLPTKRLAEVFSGKLREAFQTLVNAGTLRAGRYSARTLLQAAEHCDWVVFAKRPMAGPQQVIAYFARYTRRIAISNRRILAYDGNNVTFSYREREHGNRKAKRTVSAVKFCRLFLQHVLPPGFVRIRRYGILSNRVLERALAQCRASLDTEPLPSPVARDPHRRLLPSLRRRSDHLSNLQAGPSRPERRVGTGTARLLDPARVRACAMTVVRRRLRVRMARAEGQRAGAARLTQQPKRLHRSLHRLNNDLGLVAVPRERPSPAMTWLTSAPTAPRSQSILDRMIHQPSIRG